MLFEMSELNVLLGSLFRPAVEFISVLGWEVTDHSWAAALALGQWKDWEAETWLRWTLETEPLEEST